MAIFAGGLAALIRARRGLDLRVVLFLVLACGALLGGLHWTDYHQIEAGSRGFMQGRYVFPVIGVMALALAGAVSLLPARPVGDRDRRGGRCPVRVPPPLARARAGAVLCVASWSFLPSGWSGSSRWR